MGNHEHSEHWDGHLQHSPEYRKIVLALACAGIATFAQLYSPQGLLPEIAETLHITPAQSALMISTSTIGLAVGVLPWSWVADRIGRLPTMKYALIFACVLGFAVTLCPSFTGILILRALEGLSLGGLAAVVLTYLQEEIHPAYTAVDAGTYVSGTTLGGLLGRIVAAPIGSVWGWRFGVGAVVILSAVAVFAFLALTPAPRGYTAPTRENRPALARNIWVNLRSPTMLALYAQGFLLMGGFVTIYNYLGFHVTRAPYGLSTTLASLLFLAYLAGTFSSRRAGVSASKFGRLPVLLTCIAVMVAGVLLTMIPWLPAILVGLVVLTTGFFGAHAIASGWSAAAATSGRAQATSLYNFFYYAGSSLLGWLGGIVFAKAGWEFTALTVVCAAVIAAVIAILGTRAGRAA